MKKKLIAVTAIMTLAFGALAGCGGNKPAATSNNAGGASGGETIKIGANLELTGDVASYGTSARDGAKLAIEEINNAGGVLGKKLELVEADNASKNEESIRAAQKLLSEKVVAIVGAATSGNSVAMIPAVTEKKVPFISPSGTAEKVTVDERSGKLNEFAFRASFIDPFQGTVAAKFAINDLKAKTAAIYTDSSNDYSKGLAKSFKEQFTKLGGQVVAEENYQKRDTDFKAVLTRIKDKKPDVIYVPGYYEEVGKIIKQGREAGITVPFLGGDGWDSAELAKIAGNDNLKNTFFTNHYAADDKTPEVQAFVEAFKKKYNKTPDGFAILGYDSVKLIAEAIKKANSTDGTKIKDALASIKDYKAASGVISYDEKHNPVKSAVIIEMKDGKQTFKTKVNP